MVSEKQKQNRKFVYNWVYMSLYWLFFSGELFFIVVKYGPYHDNTPNSCFTFDIDPKCPRFHFYIAQIIFYLCILLLLVFVPIPQKLTCDKEYYVKPLAREITDRYTHCNQLLFPLVILLFFIVFEVAIVVSKSTSWYIIQILIDAIGYFIWFIFVFAPSTVLHELRCYLFNGNSNNLDNKEIKILACHIPFAIVVFFDFLWVLYAIFDEDFNFEEIDDNNHPLIFLQILLENVLILEWIHFVIEDMMARNHEKQQYKTVNKDEMIKLLEANDNNNDRKEEEEEEKKEHDVDVHKPEILENWCVLSSLFIFGVAVAIFGVIKLLKNQSNFQMFQGEYNDIMYWIWIIQPAITFILFFIIVVVLFVKTNEANQLSWHILWFPAIIFLMLFIVESVFGYWVNQYYFLQLINDGCGYIIFFIFALYFVRYIFSGDDFSGLSLCNKMMIDLTIGVYCLVLVLILVVRNLTEDVKSARDALEIFSGDSKLITAVAFFNIVLENALIIEWFHVLFHNLNPSCKNRKVQPASQSYILLDVKNENNE
eukprot:389626_1